MVQCLAFAIVRLSFILSLLLLMLSLVHGLGIVHGNITSSNVLVDIKEEKYVARLTDFGLATIFGGCLGDRIFGSNVRTGAIRWIAPELLKAHDRAPTMQTDMYSFGRVMFHVLTLVIPWSDMNDSVVSHKILGGENISRPATPDMMTVRWNEIAQCWSSDASTRPSAKLVMDFLRSEIEALAGAVCSLVISSCGTRSLLSHRRFLSADWQKIIQMHRHPPRNFHLFPKYNWH
ncbi:kinase-like protein [Suillus hirtellus]|nr:kinase-like protein [Suillus hirtellus]